MLFGVSLFFHTQFMMKQATTIEEQVELLKNRGMVIGDEEKAKEIL